MVITRTKNFQKESFEAKQCLSVAFHPTNGDYMICMETCGSGVVIGTMTTTLKPHKQTKTIHKKNTAKFFVGEAGICMQNIAGRPIAITLDPILILVILAFVLFFQASKNI